MYVLVCHLVINGTAYGLSLRNSTAKSGKMSPFQVVVGTPESDTVYDRIQFQTLILSRWIIQTFAGITYL